MLVSLYSSKKAPAENDNKGKTKKIRAATSNIYIQKVTGRENVNVCQKKKRKRDKKRN